MTTPYADLTEREQAVVQMYDETARQLHELLMVAHRKAQELAAIHSQNSVLFLTTMNMSEDLPIPSGASVNATAGTTNALNNARIAAETFIALNVTNKAVFRQMIGADRCPELG
jgi:hypothetical protein